MQSNGKAKDNAKFEPRSVAQSKLYNDNVRLQRLCYLHRKHIKGMQTQLELIRAKYENALLNLRAITQSINTPAEKRAIAAQLLEEARRAEGFYGKQEVEAANAT